MFPDWFALITQSPTPWKVTTPELIEQTEVGPLAIVKATDNPEVAVAVGVYSAEPTRTEVGAPGAKLMVWLR